MAKIPFNIKYRPEIESGKYKVVTQDDFTVALKKVKCANTTILLAFVGKDEGPVDYYKCDDIRILDDMFCNHPDLFILTDGTELTDFEKEFGGIIEAYKDKRAELTNEGIKNHAGRLLALARKQLQPEIDAEIDKAYKNFGAVQYRRGKEDALKDVPHWKHMYAGAGGNGDGRYVYLIKDGIDSYRLSPVITGGDDYLVLAELNKLPKV